jgi:UDP-N-acetylmuramate dehydrogenase
MSSLTPHFRDLQTLNTLTLPCQAQEFILLNDLAQLPALSALYKKNQKSINTQGFTDQFSRNNFSELDTTNPLNKPHKVCALHILGGGSNLVLPRVLRQPVVHVQLKGIRLLKCNGDAVGDASAASANASTNNERSKTHHRVRVAAGENWHDWVTFALNQGWYGLENLALIPGSVGAAPVQNIGAYGVEVAQLIESVEVWNLNTEQIEVLPAKACDFSYRNSRFKRATELNEMIVAVTFALPKTWQPVLNYPDLKPLTERHLKHPESITAHDVYQLVCEVRQRKLPDPAVMPNAGSFFQNPIVPREHAEALKKEFPHLVSYPQADGSHKLAAGWLIDQCGWKGKRLGPVGMHANQALVLVNPGGGDCDDVMALANVVRQDVQTRFRVMLQIEPICWAET